MSELPPAVPASDSPSAPPLPRSRRGRSVILGLVAVLGLGGAGWSIWRNVGESVLEKLAESRRIPPKSPEQEQQDRRGTDNRPIGEEPAYWSEVALFRAGPNRPRPVVVVRRAVWTGSEDTGSIRGLLTREIIRQGLVLAARELSDAVVRDLAVGDPDEPGPADRTLRLGSLVQTDFHRRGGDPLGARINLVEGSGPSARLLVQKRLDVVPFQVPIYGKLVNEVEQMVSNDFRTALSGGQIPQIRAPQLTEKPSALPDGVEARLGSLSEIDQFAAIRALHDDIHQRGPSPARWQALARGYAMLGSMTELLPSAASAVFKARALLYAQRAATAEHDSPSALRAQAVAESLSGTNAEARYGHSQADKADGGKGMTSRDQTIRAFLDLNPETLGQLVQANPDDLLPLYLRGLVATRVFDRTGEGDQVCRTEMIAAQDQVLAKFPDCFRALDNLNEADGVSNLHRATTQGMALFAESVARRVAEVPGLPPAVAEKANHREAGPDEVALRQALDAAAPGDTNDLSWGALAQTLREIRFWQVCRRLYFETFPLGVPTHDTAVNSRALVADHPNRDWVDLHSGDMDQVHGSHILGKLDLDGLELKNWKGMMFLSDRIDKDKSDRFWSEAQARPDPGMAVNLERAMRDRSDADRADVASKLLIIEPTSPAARAALVATKWEAVADRALDWEREQPWNTPLKVELGLQMLKQKKYDEAEQRLETALGRSAESWIFAGLAQSYRDRGMTDAYLRAAQVMLTQPDQGLDHATVSDGVAKYLIAQGRVDDAWPWAERGAQSWANWAMETAWRCAEMRRDWKEAESWLVRQSQRYPNQWLSWLAWCLRTGHGHPEPASALVWGQWEAGRRGQDADEAATIVALALLTNRPDIARAGVEEHLSAPSESAANLRLFQLVALERLGDRKARDEAIDKILADPKSFGPKTLRIFTLLVGWDRHRETEKLADVLAQADGILGEIPAERRPNTEALTGVVLDLLGQPAEAIPYLKRADVAVTGLYFRLLARQILVGRNEPVADFYLNPPVPKTEPQPEGPAKF